METLQVKSQSLHMDEQTWKSMGRIYRRLPFLKHPAAVRIIALLIMLPVIILINLNKDECTCADQIPDQSLKKKADLGNKQVQSYLQTRDNAIMCAARRQELLKKLEKEKKQRFHPSKS